MYDIKRLYFAEKSIVFPGWSKPDPETQVVHFDAPVEIGGVTEAGLVLHGNCKIDRPDCHVSLELRIQRQPGKHAVSIERLDWRGLDGGHSNYRAKYPYSGREVGPTHLHAFSMNYSRSEGRMRKGLRAARGLYCEPSTFEEVRTLAGKRMRINNIDVVERPNWVYTLFDGVQPDE